jgi:hypothetical protein
MVGHLNERRHDQQLVTARADSARRRAVAVSNVSGFSTTTCLRSRARRVSSAWLSGGVVMMTRSTSASAPPRHL